MATRVSYGNLALTHLLHESLKTCLVAVSHYRQRELRPLDLLRRFQNRMTRLREQDRPFLRYLSADYRIEHY